MAQPVVAHTEIIMGLPFSIHLRLPVDMVRARTTLANVWDDLRRYDRIFSTYRTDSEISRIDRGELDAEDADPLVQEMLGLAEQAHWLTHGAFDIRASGHLEPSGLVKGWAAERAFTRLFELQTAFYANAGGDMLLHSPVAEPWRVGIEHPADTSGLLAVLELSSGAVATSGSAHRGAHIVDRAGEPARGVRQASVIGPTLTWADVLATAVVADGLTHPDIGRWPAGYDVLLVNDDEQMAATRGATAKFAAGIPSPAVHYRLSDQSQGCALRD